jgi:hypothetical protein
MSIQIPVRDSDEIVEVSIDSLPEDETVIIEILKNESSPFKIWLQFGVK